MTIERRPPSDIVLQAAERATGQLRYDSSSRITETRVDGWFSALTGFGIEGKDRRLSASFGADVIDDQQVEEIWRGDDIGARIIEVVPDEAMRSGFELNVGDKRLAEDLAAELELLRVDEVVRDAKKIERAFGGAGIFPVINDGSAQLSDPLNTDRISRIEHLQVFEPRELQPATWYGNPLKPKFGEPRTYRLFPRSRGMTTHHQGVEIHESRLIIFRGIRVTRRQISPGGWGDSVLNRVYHVLRDYNISWAAATALLHEFSQAAFKIKGLAQLIASDRDDVIKARIRAVELSRSTINAILMDSEEEYERKSTPTAGLSELLTALLTRVAAAADMPITRLFGTAPSGLASTGEHEIRQWYDRVDTIRRLGIKPQLARLVQLQMRSHASVTRGREPNRWSVQFNPLWQMSDMEKAQWRASVAQTDNTYVAMGAVSAEEVALSRWGGDDYSAEMAVDFKDRARLNAAGDLAAEPAPKGKEPAPPPGALPEVGPDGKPLPPEPPPASKPPGKKFGGGKPPWLRKDEVRNDVIERRGSKWVVLTEDRSRVLGTHDTEAAAQEQLRAIEAAKHARQDEGDWDEDKHPRDEDGKFGSGGDASSAASIEDRAARGLIDWEKWRDERLAKLSKIQANAVAAYSGDSYAIVNGVLRGLREDTDDEDNEIEMDDENGEYVQMPLDKYIEHMDAAVASSVTEQPLTVYRGVRGIRHLGKLKAGSVFTDRGFTSTTANPAKLEDGTAKSGSTVVFEISIPKGHHALPVSGFLNEEEEVLLPRGQSFKVTSISKRADDVTIVKATTVQKR